MQKTGSPKKLEANRRNAEKSTGPKTTEGKLASSQNAAKPGMLSKGLRFEREEAAEERGEPKQ